MSVLKSVRSRTLLSALSVLVVVAGMLFGANAASADSVQVQSYQRASQTQEKLSFVQACCGMAPGMNKRKQNDMRFVCLVCYIEKEIIPCIILIGQHKMFWSLGLTS